MSSLGIILLAAGEGTRMKSPLTKVLHSVVGHPMVYYPLRAGLGCGADQVVLVVNPNNGGAVLDAARSAFPQTRIDAAVQDPPRGTGDAARVGLAALDADIERVLILCGDSPLLRTEDLTPLLAGLGENAVALLSYVLDDPSGYGRLLRAPSGALQEIREHRDLVTPEERATREVNSGLYVVRRAFLEAAVARIGTENAQGEFYLTDIVALAAADGLGAVGIPGDAESLQGVNDREQLAVVEAVMRARQ